jgi:hypothetical protein
MNLNEFKSQALQQGGARANLFEVEGAIGNNSDGGLLKFLCKSASIPASEIGEITVPWRGRQFKLPGDRIFTDWDIVITSDAAYDLRDKFETWHNSFQHHQGNVSEVGDVSTPLFQDWSIYWLGRDGERSNARKYTMVGAWPKSVGSIDLAMDTNDTLAEFTVTMTYQWWESPSTK